MEKFETLMLYCIVRIVVFGIIVLLSETCLTNSLLVAKTIHKPYALENLHYHNFSMFVFCIILVYIDFGHIFWSVLFIF